jgi:xanthine dehydrogenase iron-sulfur cluster and FAD-binding subunit A
MDISSVSAGMRVALDDAGMVTDICLAYGGMAATTKRATNAEAYLMGRRWSEDTVEDAAARLTSDFTPMSDHRGSNWYRETVAANLLRGFYQETQQSDQPRLPLHPSGTVLGGAQ